jgi:hypothetical protein
VCRPGSWCDSCCERYHNVILVGVLFILLLKLFVVRYMSVESYYHDVGYVQTEGLISRNSMQRILSKWEHWYPLEIPFNLVVPLEFLSKENRGNIYMCVHSSTCFSKIFDLAPPPGYFHLLGIHDIITSKRSKLLHQSKPFMTWNVLTWYVRHVVLSIDVTNHHLFTYHCALEIKYAPNIHDGPSRGDPRYHKECCKSTI